MNENAIVFLPLQQIDLPLVSQWLEQPHVARWWDELNQLADIESTLTDDRTQGFIIKYRTKPIGYIQRWQPEFGPRDAEWTFALSPETRGIDIFIGEVSMVGKGIGSAVISKFKNNLFDDGAPRVVIDPDERNTIAIRAYEKAGLKAFDRYRCEGDVQLLMEAYPDPE